MTGEHPNKSEEKPRKVHIIYIVKCPDTRKCVYVGQSRNLNRRIANHIRAEKRPRIKRLNIKLWMYNTVSAGKHPIFEMIDYAYTKEEAEELETAWIRYYAEKGHPLLNKWCTHTAIIKSYQQD